MKLEISKETNKERRIRDWIRFFEKSNAIKTIANNQTERRGGIKQGESNVKEMVSQMKSIRLTMAPNFNRHSEAFIRMPIAMLLQR